MTIFQIAREFGGIASSGGLGQVVSGIAKSLAKHSWVKSSVLIPLYGFVDSKKFDLIDNFTVQLNKDHHDVKVYRHDFDGVILYFFSYKLVSEKMSIYTYSKQDVINFPSSKKGDGYKDNDEINLIFQLAVLKFLGECLKEKGVLILHDAHTSLIPGFIQSSEYYSRFFDINRILFLIHNAGDIYHQKISYKKIKKIKKIDKKILKRARVGKNVDPMFLASLLTKTITVSDYYANELLGGYHHPGDGGFGEFLNSNSLKLTGITNGIDPEIIDKEYINSLDEVLYVLKKYCKLECFGELEKIDTRVAFLFQNRITEQKGIDELVESIDRILNSNRDINFIVMGEGEERYEGSLKALCKKYSGNIIFIDGYDEYISRSLFASSDFFLITSRWEPCGITDMEASLFLSIPIARDTGGLKKIEHGITGYKYKDIEDLVELIIILSKRFKENYQSIIDEKNRGRAEILNKHSWDSVVKDHYLPLLKKMSYE